MKKYPLSFPDLITQIQKNSAKAEWYQKKLHNIAFIEKLNKIPEIKKLSFRKNEKQILIYETKEEALYIQFPGKESAREPNVKPWDFRPKILLKKKNEYGPDLSFVEIWGQIYDELEKMDKTTREDISAMLSVVFYRMAYMIDHKLVSDKTMTTRKITHTDGKILTTTDKLDFELKGLYKYQLSETILEQLEKHLPKIANISLRAFLYYNELLVWNEDCKYYYRDKFEKKSDKINVRIGRVNTLLSHINVLGFLQGNVHFDTLINGFIRGKGVAPIGSSALLEICRDLIVKYNIQTELTELKVAEDDKMS